MMKAIQVLLLIISSTFIFACGEKEVAKAPTVAVPETLQDVSRGKVSLKSDYGRAYDIVGSLYFELVEKSPVLKSIEKDIDDFEGKPESAHQSYADFESKSKAYYSDANRYVLSIKDSVLQKRMLAAVEASEARYKKITGAYEQVFERMKQTDLTLQDHHTVLKVLSTLPVIETYQNTSKPEIKEFHKLLKEQNRLLNRVDSVSPKH